MPASMSPSRRRFSASRWVELAIASIEETIGRERTPLVAGDGLLHSRAVDPLFIAPDLDLDQREKLEGFLNPLPLAELRRWCEAVDPARAHLGRYQLIRALEIAILSGHRISELQQAGGTPSAYTPAYLMVDPGARLAGRIERRVDAMLDAGGSMRVLFSTRRFPRMHRPGRRAAIA